MGSNPKYSTIITAPIAQLEEHFATNEEVGVSSTSGSSKMLVYPSGLRELPAKQLFVGSTPTTNSIKMAWLNRKGQTLIRFVKSVQIRYTLQPKIYQKNKKLVKIWKIKNNLLPLN
jgi:hypothetical protein